LYISVEAKKGEDSEATFKGTLEDIMQRIKDEFNKEKQQR